jgi:hypothetical protein
LGASRYHKGITDIVGQIFVSIFSDLDQCLKESTPRKKSGIYPPGDFKANQTVIKTSCPVQVDMGNRRRLRRW